MLALAGCTTGPPATFVNGKSTSIEICTSLTLVATGPRLDATLRNCDVEVVSFAHHAACLLQPRVDFGNATWALQGDGAAFPLDAPNPPCNDADGFSLRNNETATASYRWDETFRNATKIDAPAGSYLFQLEFNGTIAQARVSVPS